MIITFRVAVSLYFYIGQTFCTTFLHSVILYLSKHYTPVLVEADTWSFCSKPRVIKYILTNVFLTVKNDYNSPECFQQGLPGQNLKKWIFAYS